MAMNAFASLFALLGILARPGLALAATPSSEPIVLHVLSAEDYINYGPDAESFLYYDEEGNKFKFGDTLNGFEQYMRETTGKTVRVIYDTYDTNETMYSSLQTGRTKYDLICASDYMCQKMMGQGMLQPIDIASDVPNYDIYASRYIKDTIANIKATVDGEEKSFGDYAVDYMWGTLGILYNPAKVAKDKNMDEDEVKFAMKSYDALWDARFANEMSVKDSMRDTYAIGIMKTFEEEIVKGLKDSPYFDEDYNLIEGCFDEAMKSYNVDFTKIFNRSDEKTVLEVKSTLMSLKENVFGFEVDSGKEDMVKGLIGMNLAWSGDAVFAEDTAEGQYGNELYYSLPETGGNIWFDTWVMPKESEGETREFALKFLDFLCHPDVASANMNYIGYSTCVAGDSMLDLIRSWYDPRSFELYAYDDAEDDFVYDDEGNYVPNEGYEEGDYTSPNGISTWDEIAEENEWDIVDLSYIYEGTLSDEVLADYPDPLGDTPSTNPYLFYTDELEEVSFGEESTIVGRQFFTQYPSKEILPKLAIMADYGPDNKYVLAMWEDVKSNNLPIAGVILFAAVLGGLAAAIIVTVIGKTRQRKAMEKRIKAARSAADKH